MVADLSEATLERLPPQSIEAEQAILGALLISPDVISRVIDQLDPEQFYRKAHQVIAAAIMDLYEKNEPIDIVTCSQFLKDQGKLDSVGGRQYLTDLAMSIATTANAEYYAKTVNEKSLLRNLIKAGSEIVASCYEETDADLCVDKAEQLIFSIAQRRSANNLTHIKDVVTESFARIEKRYEQRDALSGVPTGFYDLDDMTSGWQKSDLIILAARPSMGKTAFCLNLAQHAAVEGRKPVALFSLEMSKEQLVQRLLCAEARIDANRMRTGFLQSSDWQHLATAMGRLSEAPIFIDDTAVVSHLDVRAKCRRLKSEHKSLGLIIIDYIQLMSGRAKSDGNRVQEVSEISRGLKQLARELDCPVIALSQLSRAVESRQNKRPMLSDLRESGCLTGDTLVLVADTGEYERMDALVGRKGFHVFAMNTETWKFERKKVVNAFSTGRKPVFKMKTRSGKEIRATGNHKFLTVDGWRRLDELDAGMYLATPRAIPALSNGAGEETDNSLNRDVIPPRTWFKYIEPARVAAGVSTEQLHDVVNAPMFNSRLYRSDLSREQAANIATVVHSESLQRLAESDVYWDEIISISAEGQEEVYDLTVQGLHNFVANNIIVHNSIEQDADIVMFIYRDEYYNAESDKRGEAEIIIAKQRNGPVGTVELLYQASITRFLNKATNNSFAGAPGEG
jgi:replicative DNA helicase